MRIATNQFRNQAVTTMMAHEAELSRLQEQASTGRKVNRASDDPLAVAEAERLRSSQARFDIEKRMMSYAQNLMAQGESVVGSSIQSMQEARDIVISARNGIRSKDDWHSLAEKVTHIRNELFSLANHQDHEGGYLFGGPGSERPPFAPEKHPEYVAAPGIRQNGLTVPFTLSLDGGRIFMGFGQNGDRSVFEELDKIADALANPTPDTDAVLSEGLEAIDKGLAQLEVARSSLGEQMRILSSRERVLTSGEMGTAQRRSDLVDTDYAEVLSDTQSRSLALRAAMQTYSQVSQLSLFNYL
ncbi:MAG: flagellar hook-associated protein FlgL [Lautropia sp.]|nr:flagellar hook-associated protein FlgL [Lautropia sp.]